MPTRTAKPLDAAAVAALLEEFGRRAELAGGNPYQARAYRRAAEQLRALTVPLADVVAQERLTEIPGVGEAIAERIATLHRTGTHPRLEAMRAALPASVLGMLDIPKLRARDVLKLHGLGIRSVTELEEACRSGRLKGVKGVSQALQDNILRGIEVMRKGEGQRHIHRAGALLQMAAENVRASHPELTRIAFAGDFRRGCELVRALTLVAEVPEKNAPIRSIATNEIALTVAGRNRYGAALVLATGSEEHVAALRKVAAKQGLTLDEKGLHGGKLVATPEEADVYAALGLAYVAPELREGADEVKLASNGGLPELVEAADIRGILHAHTDASDGGNTLKQMAEATRKRGYGYFGVADHSQTAAYAGGLTPEEIAAQHAEADALNAHYGGRFRVFKGIESDIRADGALDYPDEVLEKFDFVVASIHSRFNLDEDAQTKRMLRAIAHPATTVLGHMTGRMLLRRTGYTVDIEAVLKACARHGVAVEINANPHRLDLDWRWHRRALELGCVMSINPDAHSIAELDLMRWGLAMARKGGVPKDRVLNALDRRELEQYLAERKKRGKKKRRRRRA